MGAAIEWLSLGNFEVVSETLIITDPYYGTDMGSPLQGMVMALNGTWKAEVGRKNTGSWGIRNAYLIAYHQDHCPHAWDYARWPSLLPCTIGVDSGQAGIFDKWHFKDDTIIPKEFFEEHKGNFEKDWYGLCCSKTLYGVFAGVIPFGVVSSSGYGDGSYDAWGVWRGHDLVAVKIDFISDEEDL